MICPNPPKSKVVEVCIRHGLLLFFVSILVSCGNSSGTAPSVLSSTPPAAPAAPAAVSLTSISPSGDDLVGGSTIQLSGVGFQSGVVASVDGKPCTSTTFVSSTTLNCVAPSGSVAANTLVNVKVTNPDTGASTLSSSFKYVTATNCKDWKNLNYNTSGNFSVDHDHNSGTPRVTVSCDQSTDGGGWMLVLNYLHKGGSNPNPVSLTAGFPLPNSSTLGVDESGSLTSWAHLDGSFLSSLTFSEIRFYCKTSAHSRVVDFKTSQASCFTYLKTGAGSCNTVGSSYTALPAHTALYIPAGVNGTILSGTATTLTNFPFYKNATGHWGIQGLGNRWECDDYPNDSSKDTLHRAWIR